ncbi:hypothetical protein OG21DRAFT_1502154 [Imleria badia]|nr:hypothetical protein OG21DRAFT_1502154 [Imleria badia]
MFSSSQSLTFVTVSSRKTSMFPAAPSLHDFPLVNSDANGVPQNLRAPRLATHSQSHWSVATTMSLAPSAAEPKYSDLLNPRTPPKDKKDKGLKTIKKRTRFISLISRFSPGRVDPSSTVTRYWGQGEDQAYKDLEQKLTVSSHVPFSRRGASIADITYVILERDAFRQDEIPSDAEVSVQLVCFVGVPHHHFQWIPNFSSSHHSSYGFIDLEVRACQPDNFLDFHSLRNTSSRSLLAQHPYPTLVSSLTLAISFSATTTCHRPSSPLLPSLSP